MSEPLEVAAAVTYNAEKDQYLLLKRAETMEMFPGFWDFPSGRIEGGAPEEEALRELEEETGFYGEIVREGEPFSIDSDYGSFRIHPFLVEVEGEEPRLNPEHTEYRWVDIGEIEEFETVKALEKDLEAVGALEMEE